MGLKGLKCDNPVFILTASRSGSTLLRFILDTHPDFACPPETMIAMACTSLLRSWDLLEHAGSGHQRLVTEDAQLPPEGAGLIRDTVDRLYGAYLSRRGKLRWCDKSLDSVLAAELLAEVYPQAQFVCLYRHCMDVVSSGIEACPWGISRFGFDGFVAANPGNSVAAIASYWAEWATMMLSFEEAHPDRCRRIRYEDLAGAPEQVTGDLLKFLGAAPMPGITTACFKAPHEGDGPGDEKIWFTSRVTTEGMGRGVRVPAEALPGRLRNQVNDALSRLGYHTIGPGWNDLPSPFDTRLPGTGPDIEDARPDQPPAADGAASWPGMTTLEAIGNRITEQDAKAPGLVSALWPVVVGQTLMLVVADDSGSAEVSLTFPAAGGNGAAPGDSAAGAADGPGEPVATFIAMPEVWRELLAGRANLIIEIRHGRLRCVNRRDLHRVRSDEVHALAFLLGLTQVPLVRTESVQPRRGSPVSVGWPGDGHSRS